jgi:hypothetical protein
MPPAAGDREAGAAVLSMARGGVSAARSYYGCSLLVRRVATTARKANHPGASCVMPGAIDIFRSKAIFPP